MNLNEALNYAKRVARHITKDVDSDSLAGAGAWQAFKTYNPELNVPWQRWVAKCTEQAVFMHFRSSRRRRENEVLFTDLAQFLDDEDGEDFDPPDLLLVPDELDVTQADWQLLVENFLLGWPYDVIARRNNMSISAVRRTINAAISRLETAVNSRTCSDDSVI